MTSASVKNAGLDATLLPVTAKTVSAQRTQDGQDFGTIMNRQRGKHSSLIRLMLVRSRHRE